MRALIVATLCLSLLATGVARADALGPDEPMKIHAMPLRRRNPRQRNAAIGLLIGSAVCLTLGGVFVGLAYNANKDATANMTYHPTQEDKRVDYQVADGFLLGVGAAAGISGLVLLW